MFARESAALSVWYGSRKMPLPPSRWWTSAMLFRWFLRVALVLGSIVILAGSLLFIINSRG